MKNKIKVYILLGLIILLLFYVVMRKDKNINYTLPEMTKIEQGNITKISLNNLEITKKADKWYLPSGFMGSETEMDELLSALDDFKIIDMISESENYKRFGLDSDKKLEIFQNDKKLLSVNIGAVSSTGNYTYIKFPNRPEVYSVRGNVIKFMDKTEDQLRNKVVLTLGDISEITITKGDVVVKKNKEESEELKASLNNLKAVNFKVLPTDNKIISVTITGETNKRLTIYEKVDGMYPATSSDVNYTFTIPEYIVKKLENI